MRRSTTLLAALGLLLLAAAATIRFVAVPMLTQLPGNTDSTAHFTGTATLLDAKALASGDTAHALATDVPVTVDRHVYVSSTSGHTAIVHDDLTLHGPGGLTMPSDHAYAMDRSTLQASTAPVGADVLPAQGVTVALPLHPEAGDYPFYEPLAGQTVPLVYQGTETNTGRSVYKYIARASGPVADAGVAASLPAALPKALAGRLAPLLPSDVVEKLAPALPTLPDPVPLTYTTQTTVTLWADKVTGIPVDATLQQQIDAQVDVDGTPVSLLPVLAIDIAATDATSEEAAAKAADAARLLALLETWIPLAAALAGMGLLVLALRRRGRATPRADVSAPQPPRVGAGRS
jgi:hypothetical protein